MEVEGRGLLRSLFYSQFVIKVFILQLERTFSLSVSQTFDLVNGGEGPKSSSSLGSLCFAIRPTCVLKLLCVSVERLSRAAARCASSLVPMML